MGKENRMLEEVESAAYEEVYDRIRMFAEHLSYDLLNREIQYIIESAEVEGDCVLDCSDDVLREITED